MGQIMVVSKPGVYRRGVEHGQDPHNIASDQPIKIFFGTTRKVSMNV